MYVHVCMYICRCMYMYVCMYTCMYILCMYLYMYVRMYNYMCVSVFLISSYGTSLAQRASYLALHISLFGPGAQLILIILSLTALNLCSLAVFPMAHTLTIVEPIWPMLQNISKTLVCMYVYIHMYMYVYMYVRMYICICTYVCMYVLGLGKRFECLNFHSFAVHSKLNFSL